MLVIINRQPSANIIETVDRIAELLPQLRASIPSAINGGRRDGANDDDPGVDARGRAHADRSRSAGDPRRVPVPAQLSRGADCQRRRAGVAGRERSA